ncbi:MAG: NAD+ synthase, partial [Dehalococcoidia bacterium]|nr:NAD+ synthase [Dehalococcoidia bacterium]
VAYNNLVGGQDELVFEGGSLVIDAEGAIVARGKHFEEDLVIAQLGSEALTGHTTPTTSPLPTRLMEKPHRIAGVYEALVLGTKDYVRKNGFNKVVIGLSGGIDSSLVATVAVDALGASNVVGVSMPSRYSSPASKSDAEMLAENLGIKLKVIPIEKAFSSYLEMLADSFINTEPNAAEENIQARIRGNILFALSNKFGWLVLACSNRSETATGYTTLYGDMAGGFIPLKDVPKTMVYQLATHRNVQAGKEVIPSSVLSREPSAELRPAHKDTDTLPPYELLDPILRAYVEDHLPIDDIVAMGFHREVVTQVAHLVDSSEYKRRQAAPGIRITPGDYCQGRRLPITNRFRE